VTIETIPLLRHLSRIELQALRAIVQVRTLAAGQEIFHEGAPGDGVYFVKSGEVEIAAGSGERRVFTRFGEGEIFGEMAVIEHRPRSASAMATKPTEVFFLPRGEMLPFIEHSPGLAFALLQLISHRLRELNQLHLREIVEAERLAAVGHFARGIVHDLKNPLSIIGLTAEVFSNPNTAPENRAQAKNRISRQIQRINDLITDLLIFTENHQNAGLQPADFRAFVFELFAEIQTEAAQTKSIRVILENKPPAELVLFDARRLSRVFQNLVNNAMDVLDKDGAILVRFNSNPHEIMVEIEDTGPGFSPEIAGKLFEPFATHGKVHGTGLGLAICKKIIEDHGGKISARSEPRHGAIFCFTLPIAK
jgi:signal transduction histidine kinase